jgi:hypothetical protein
MERKSERDLIGIIPEPAIEQVPDQSRAQEGGQKPYIPNSEQRLP